MAATTTIWTSLVPRPRSVEPTDGGFVVPETMNVYCGDDHCRAIAETVFVAAARITGHLARTRPGQWALTADPRSAHLSVSITPDRASERYTLTVTPERIEIHAGGTPGVAAGFATLVQALLLQSSEGVSGGLQAAQHEPQQEHRLPAVHIEDAPHHGWRGFMFDTARHFFPIGTLHRLLDLVWLFRLNRFHLHLTDDQGWRVPISDYPDLTDVGAWRHDGTSEHGRYGGHYTRDELRALDMTAVMLGITLVPEIDLPGHASAALTAYPDLGCTGSPPGVETRWGIFDAVISPVGATTKAFVESVFADVSSLFSGPFIHIGGDEVLTTTWQQSDECREYIAGHGLSGVDDLYQVIVRGMAETVLSLGKRPVAWDEASQLDLPRETIIVNWRGPEFAKAALESGYDIVLAPQSKRAYLDHKHLDDEAESGRLGVCSVRDSSSFEPDHYLADTLDAARGSRILGGQANLWTEGVQSLRQAEYMGIVRLAAISEGLWTGAPGTDDWDDFSSRLSRLRQALYLAGYNVYPGLFSSGLS
ncbi:MAG: hypothetical protein EA383_09825 [Spirochaetaceae bacterium]|nr:MAG: hypothetical protein EA383_09825 [Spirochaetaceae bacterium]